MAHPADHHHLRRSLSRYLLHLRHHPDRRRRRHRYHLHQALRKLGYANRHATLLAHQPFFSALVFHDSRTWNHSDKEESRSVVHQVVKVT